MEITTVSTQKAVAQKPTEAVSKPIQDGAGGFMAIMQQMLSAGCSIDQLSDTLAVDLKQQLEEDGAELTAQMMAEMLGANPILLDLMQADTKLAETISQASPQLLASIPANLGIVNPEQAPKSIVLPQTINGKIFEELKAEFTKTSNEKIPVDDEGLVLEQSRFQSIVSEAQKQQTTSEGAQNKEKTPNIDELQKDVESSKYLGITNFKTQMAELNELIPTNSNEKISYSSPLEQTTDAIIQNIALGKNEFVLKLKPEGLGEITIKMVEEGSKISLNIITSSDQTNRLLSGELGALKDALRPFNAEIKEIVTSSAQVSAQLSSGQHFESFARQNMFNRQSNGSFNKNNTRFFEDGAEQVVVPISTQRLSSLDVHI